MSERRKFSRINFQGECKLIFDKASEHHDFDAMLIDISLNGALVEIKPMIIDLEEESVKLDLHLNGSDVDLILKGFVCHQNEKMLGLQFSSLDIDTMTHLKRMVELNLGDEKEAHREFSELIEQHESNQLK